MRKEVNSILAVVENRWNIIICAGLIILLFALIPGCGFYDRNGELNLNDGESVNFIGIYGRDTVELSRFDSGWRLNDGRKPDTVAVENILYAFENIDITGATTANSMDSMVSRKIVFKGDMKARIYRFYSSPDYYLLHHEGSAKIFRINIPSAPDANLDRVFSDDPSYWTEKIFLKTDPGQIRKITVIPHQGYGRGFRIVRDSSRFIVFALQREGIEIDADTERIILYLSYLDDLYYKDLIRNDSILNRIASEKPFYHFEVISSGENHSFDIFPLYKKDGHKDLFYGALSSSDQAKVMKINYAELDPLFQDIGYFYGE